MQQQRIYFVYILASRSRTLYIGVTNNLNRRLAQHREARENTFTARYRINRLVYVERFAQTISAITREKLLKHCTRAEKLTLINRCNPTWHDLSHRSQAYNPHMPSPTDPAIQSGAQHVDETEQLLHFQEAPRDVSAGEIAEENATDAPVQTHLAGLTLSMFPQGSSIRVRVGNPNSSAELYEHAFPTADEANAAMLDAGILTPEQVPDPTAPAGTHIPLNNITVQQLEAAGLKRHGASTL